MNKEHTTKIAKELKIRKKQVFSNHSVFRRRFNNTFNYKVQEEATGRLYGMTINAIHDTELISRHRKKFHNNKF